MLGWSRVVAMRDTCYDTSAHLCQTVLPEHPLIDAQRGIDVLNQSVGVGLKNTIRLRVGR